MQSDRSAVLAALGMLAAATGSEMSEERMKLYAEALSDLPVAKALDGLKTLTLEFQPKFHGHLPSIKEIREAATGIDIDVDEGARAAENFRRLMWSYDSCVEGQYGYDDASVIRKFGSRVLVALRTIGGGSRMDLARYDDEERKWALKEFKEALRGVPSESGARALVASWHPQLQPRRPDHAMLEEGDDGTEVQRTQNAWEKADEEAWAEEDNAS